MTYTRQEQLSDAKFNYGTGYIYQSGSKSSEAHTEIVIQGESETPYGTHPRSMRSAKFKIWLDRSDEGKAEGCLVIRCGKDNAEHAEVFEVELDGQHMYYVGQAFLDAARWIGFTDKNAITQQNACGLTCKVCGERIDYQWSASGGDYYYCRKCHKECLKDGTPYPDPPIMPTPSSL